jgi:hypothetical protein
VSTKNQKRIPSANAVRYLAFALAAAEINNNPTKAEMMVAAKKDRKLSAKPSMDLGFCEKR